MAIAELESAPLGVTAEEITTQLSRIVESQHFRHSNRYPALLKYLVEQTQQGHAAQLKERLLGVEVFHRTPDYDTNTDPVVRVTAAEVRKRIAQYYQDPEHSGQIRIEVPTGSYVPRFLRPPGDAGRAGGELEAGSTVVGPDAPAAEAGADGATAGALPVPQEPDRVAGSSRRGWLVSSVGLVLGLLLGLGAMQLWAAVTFWQERDLHEFWSPFAASDRVVVVIGDHTVGMQGNALRADQGLPASQSEDVLKLMNEYEQVTLTDVTSLFKITNYMVRHDQNFSLVGAGAADIADLRNGPVLLFAGLDNRWTMRLTQHLRYRFMDNPDDSVGVIQDAQVPSRTWRVDFKIPYSRMGTDYALVARYFDPLLEQPVIVAAGLGATGTVSASEFVTSERCIEDLKRLAPKDGKQKNVEVVLALPVIDGHAGPPHIVASQFW